MPNNSRRRRERVWRNRYRRVRAQTEDLNALKRDNPLAAARMEVQIVADAREVRTQRDRLIEALQAVKGMASTWRGRFSVLFRGDVPVMRIALKSQVSDATRQG